jgi:hypothetical protein
MIKSHSTNPFAAISTIAGGSSGLSKGASSGGRAAAGSGDGLDAFRAELKQGTFAPNLSQPMPPAGQGQRLFAMG